LASGRVISVVEVVASDVPVGRVLLVAAIVVVAVLVSEQAAHRSTVASSRLSITRTRNLPP